MLKDKKKNNCHLLCEWLLLEYKSTIGYGHSFHMDLNHFCNIKFRKAWLYAGKCYLIEIFREFLRKRLF